MDKKWISATKLCERWRIEPLELYEIARGSVERTNDPEKLKDRPEWVERVYCKRGGRSIFALMGEGEGGKKIIGHEVLNVGLQAYEKNGEPIEYHRLSGATKGNRGWKDSSTAIYIGETLFLREQAERYGDKIGMPPIEASEQLNGMERQELGRLRAEKKKWDRSIEAAILVGIYCFEESRKKPEQKPTRTDIEGFLYKFKLPKTTEEKIISAIPTDYRQDAGRPKKPPES